MAKKAVRSPKRSVNPKVASREMIAPQFQTSTPKVVGPVTIVKNVGKYFTPLRVLGMIVILALAVLLWNNKGIVIAGKVNNQPIWRWDLEQRMVSRSGSQIFDEMVNESLLKSAAAKKGIIVTDVELDQKVKEIEKTLNGQISLTDALAQQGMSMEEFRRQVGLQVMVEKLTADSVKVTEDEITKYISENQSLLTATDEAGLRTEAKQNLMQEKQGAAFQKIFDDLKKNANIKSYL